MILKTFAVAQIVVFATAFLLYQHFVMHGVFDHASWLEACAALINRTVNS